MNAICTICSSELLKDKEVVSTSCGHVFHRRCLETWVETSQTCPTCRHATTRHSITRLFFDFDDQKAAALKFEDILKTNDELTSSINELKKKMQKLEMDCLDSQAKLRESSSNESKLRRQKQLDEMTINSLRMVKDESMKEIVKLNQQISCMKFDLLSERQVRRLHQMKLHELLPDDENFDISSIPSDILKENPLKNGKVDSSNDLIESTSSSSSSFRLPFWKMSCEAAIVNVSEPSSSSAPYIIPSKIQKGSKEVQNPSGKLTAFRNQRSLWKNEKPIGYQFKPPDQIPSTSSTILGKNQRRTFGEGLNFTAPITIPSSSTTRETIFNFSIESPTFPTPSVATVTNASTSSNLNSNLSSPLRSYRDVRESSTSPGARGGLSGPKASDR